MLASLLASPPSGDGLADRVIRAMVDAYGAILEIRLKNKWFLDNKLLSVEQYLIACRDNEKFLLDLLNSFNSDCTEEQFTSFKTFIQTYVERSENYTLQHALSSSLLRLPAPIPWQL